MSVNYSLAGTANSGADFQCQPSNVIPNTIIFPPGATSVSLAILPKTATNVVGPSTVVLTLGPAASYTLANPISATVTLGGNAVPVRSLSVNGTGASLRWNSTAARSYRISYKNNLNDPTWLLATNVTATSVDTVWTDLDARNSRQRFYTIAQIN